MKTPRGYRSRNIEDRRGTRSRGALAAGGLGLPVILVIVLLQVCGGDSSQLGDILGQLGQGQVAPPPVEQREPDAPDPQADLVSYVGFTLDDVQQTWEEIFAASDLTYEPSTLVLYESDTPTNGCGYGQAALGPFYCPADQTTYIDLSFFNLLAQRFDAPGDFAQSYVIAHEIGHHVQNLLGVSDQVRAEQQANPGAANELSVRLELQADCFAGVWGASAYADDLLERGDLEEAITAAEAIGDDNIAAQAGQANPNPESFTHGTSEQRQEWFRRGFDTGDPNQCNTFG